MPLELNEKSTSPWVDVLSPSAPQPSDSQTIDTGVHLCNSLVTCPMMPVAYITVASAGARSTEMRSRSPAGPVGLGALCVVLAAAEALAANWLLPFRTSRNIQTVEPIEDVAARFGYSIERHTIKTDDGYLLTYHRVPRGRNQTRDTDEPRRVILFINGILMSSASSLTSNNGFAYQMADSGYDVWLGNYRGSMYSRRHVRLDPDRDPQFWDVSLHDFGTKDLPAAIDYILSLTGRQKLVYIGASMGTTMFWVLGATLPHYMDKVSTMIAIAPVARPSHAAIVDGTVKIQTFDNIYHTLQRLGVYELFRYSETRGAFVYNTCSIWLRPVCSRALDLFGLATGEDWDMNRILQASKYSPAGVPTKVVHHFLQIASARRFQQYDYGQEMNELFYRSPDPPEYDLKNVAPNAIYFIYSDVDQIAAKEDVHWLIEQLPKKPIRLFKEVNHLGHFGLGFDKKISKLWVRPLADFVKQLPD